MLLCLILSQETSSCISTGGKVRGSSGCAVSEGLGREVEIQSHSPKSTFKHVKECYIGHCLQQFWGLVSLTRP